MLFNQYVPFDGNLECLLTKDLLRCCFLVLISFWYLKLSKLKTSTNQTITKMIMSLHKADLKQKNVVIEDIMLDLVGIRLNVPNLL